MIKNYYDRLRIAHNCNFFYFVTKALKFFIIRLSFYDCPSLFCLDTFF